MSKSARKKAQRQREQLSLIGMVAGVVILFVVIVALVISQTQQNQPAPVGTRSYADVNQAVTDQGFPILGKADTKVVLAEFSNFACPVCLDYLPKVESYIDNYVRTGKARFVYVPITFGTESSIQAAYGALCAVKYNKFWELGEALFEVQRQTDLQLGGEDHFTLSLITDAASKLGLDAQAIQSCILSGDMQKTLQNAGTFADQQQVTGTPTLSYSIDGGKTFLRFKGADGSDLEGEVPASVVDSLIAQNQ